MTRIARFMTCALLCATVAACSGDDSGTNNSGDDDNTVSATVDGAAWTAKDVWGSYSNGALWIRGAPTNTIQGDIFIKIPNITQTGTYDVGPGFSDTVEYWIVRGRSFADFDLWSTTGVGATGTVTVTKLSSTEAEGTFSVTAIGALGTKVFTDGKFDVRFNVRL